MSREPRDTTTREKLSRGGDGWKPAALLPVPVKEDGYTYRYIRTAMAGSSDVKNVSSRLREGWEPVKAVDHPELQIATDPDSKYGEGVEVGGLLLCKIDSKIAQQRNEYYAVRNKAQIDSVDNNYLRENDPRMPLSKPERRTRVTFGSGSKTGE